jgi:hypothetical protein
LYSKAVPAQRSAVQGANGSPSLMTLHVDLTKAAASTLKHIARDLHAEHLAMLAKQVIDFVVRGIGR